MSQPLYIQLPFVGRKHEQKAYHQLLTSSSPWVLIITGQGGNGKSALLRQFAQQTPSDRVTVTLNFANETLRIDALTILESLAEQLVPYCNGQKNEAFDTTLLEGRKQIAELSRQMSQTIHVGNDASLQGASLTMSGTDAARMREQRHHIRAMVAKAFYAQIGTLDRSLVLLLDTCEWLSEIEEVCRWVMDELLPQIHSRVQHQCSVVIAGLMSPSLTVIERQDQWPLSLPMLDQSAVEDYLTTVGMNDALLRQHVYKITHGHALCVSIIATLWLEREDQPFTLADLPKLQEQFNERALVEFIQERLNQRLKTPFRELTRYGVLLRRFNLPMLQAVFPEYLSGPDAIDLFHQFIRYPYIESRGNKQYGFHDLLRELQAVEVREQEPVVWQQYHKQALEYLTREAIYSPEWYYHAIAYHEEQGMSDWWDATQDLQNAGTDYLGALFQAAQDRALKLTPLSQAKRAFLVGRFYYSSYGTQIEAALQSYKDALSLYRQVGDRLGEANVLQAMGDVQQFRDERETALQSYEQALILFRQVGSTLGEANCYLEQGRIALGQEDYQNALILHTNAYQLYQHIQDSYSQAFLLYYRSFVYESMQEKQLAHADVERSLSIAQKLSLPFVDLLQERLHKLQENLD